jgi:hypothetical protein
LGEKLGEDNLFGEEFGADGEMRRRGFAARRREEREVKEVEEVKEVKGGTAHWT